MNKSLRNYALLAFLALVGMGCWAANAYASQGVPKIVRTDKLQIETFVYGSGPATLVIAAGNGRPAAQLNTLAEAISSNGIRVVTYNYRTLGASTGTIDGLTLHDYANDLWQVVEKLNLGKVYLAGKTYGNRVVRTASQDHPERVLGIILIGAGGEVAPSDETARLYKRYLDPSISREEWVKL
jgi:pimeloyl-ACP methyl ester carboxylesterase